MTDEEIIQGLIDGDREAFDEFYATTKETVERVCAYFLAENPGMVSACIGAYERAFRQIHAKHKPDLPPKAWMSVLAVQECMPVLCNVRQDYDMQTRALEEMANKVPVLLEITNDPKERLGFMVRGEVDDMPDPHKEFLAMSELQGLSFLEIAKRLNQSWAMVVSKLFNARQLLSKRVKEQLGL